MSKDFDLDGLAEGADIATLPKSQKGANADVRGTAVLQKLVASRTQTLSDGKRYGTAEDAREVGLRYQRALMRGMRLDSAYDDRGARMAVTPNGNGFAWTIFMGDRIYRTRKNKDDSTTPKTPETLRANGNGRKS